MRKLLSSSFVLIVLAVAASSVNAQDEINRFELFGGYSYMNLNRGLDADEIDDDFGDFPGNRVNAHGFNGSATYNFSRYIGAKFDVTLHGHSQSFEDAGIAYKLEQKVNQFMGGLQFKDNSKDGGKLRPFGHVLAGMASQSLQLEAAGGVLEGKGEIIAFDINSTDFAMKFGGGLDYKVHKNVDIRLIQFDYNPIFRGDRDLGTLGTLPSVMQGNMLLSFGVVFH